MGIQNMSSSALIILHLVHGTLVIVKSKILPNCVVPIYTMLKLFFSAPLLRNGLHWNKPYSILSFRISPVPFAPVRDGRGPGFRGTRQVFNTANAHL